MGLVLQPTSVAPVTLREVKAHLRIDSTLEDETLWGLVVAAVRYVEAETRQTLCATDVVFTLDGFPAGREIRLPKPPLQSVESITYRDGDGVTQMIDESQYIVDLTSKPGRVVLATGASWPQTDGNAAAVKVYYTAGYYFGDVPDTLALAVKMLAGHWFEQREAATDRRFDSVPLAVESILTQHAYPEAV